MALADTARLIASLELQDKFSKNAAAFDRAVGGMERRAGTLSKVGDQVGRGLSSATANLARIGVVGAGLLTVAVTNGIRELEKLENASAQTNAVLASTEGVAGQTAESIRNLAEKYEGLNATIDDKVIQSGENLLLTFTNISKKAFEPALVAALNLNTALGGGEEGLQGTIIQVGKALQDPIRGLTNLRRVGVNFSEQQKTQIKDLVAQNDLYGAQQVILAELTTEFGGSFAAAGDTATGKFARFRDVVEDSQAALATGFLPVLEKVADKVGTFLADPASVQRIEDFGAGLAGGFEKLLEVGGSLPWQEIGDAFTIVGTASKALLDAFLGLPPWVQTAVLTGWGLNKLTGGALGGIAGTLTKALATGTFGTRGATPANPLFVSQVGGVGGAPVAGGGGGGVLAGIGKFLGLTTAVGLGAVIGNEIGREVFFDPAVAPAVEFETSQFEKLIAANNPERLESGLDAVNEGLRQLGGDTALGNLLFGDQIKVLQDQKNILEGKLTALNKTFELVPTKLQQSNSTFEAVKRLTQANVEEARQTKIQAATIARITEATREPIRLTAQQTANAARLTQSTLGPLNTIAAKDMSPNVSVSTVVNVTNSATQITQSVRRLITANATRLTDAGVGL